MEEEKAVVVFVVVVVIVGDGSDGSVIGIGVVV